MTSLQLHKIEQTLRHLNAAILLQVDITDAMSETDSASVQVSCVLDVVIGELEAFAAGGDADRLRTLADRVTAVVAEDVHFATVMAH